MTGAKCPRTAHRLSRLQQPDDELEEHGLAAPALADDANGLLRGNREIDPVEHLLPPNRTPTPRSSTILESAILTLSHPRKSSLPIVAHDGSAMPPGFGASTCSLLPLVCRRSKMATLGAPEFSHVATLFCILFRSLPMLRFAFRAVAIAAAVALAGATTIADDSTIKVKIGDKFPVVALKPLRSRS